MRDVLSEEYGEFEEGLEMGKENARDEELEFLKKLQSVLKHSEIGSNLLDGRIKNLTQSEVKKQ